MAQPVTPSYAITSDKQVLIVTYPGQDPIPYMVSLLPNGKVNALNAKTQFLKNVTNQTAGMDTNINGIQALIDQATTLGATLPDATIDLIS